MGYRTALAGERDHPVYKTASALEEHIGIKCDLIHLAIFLSAAAGNMVSPLPLDIYSNSLIADLMVAQRILELLRGKYRSVDTHKQFREIERKGYAGLAVLLVRGNHRTFFRDATEYTAGLGIDVFRLPSVIRITDQLPSVTPVPHTLRIMAAQAERDLDDFAHAYATYKERPRGRDLHQLLLKLPVHPTYSCAFRDGFKGKTDSSSMLIFERLLLVVSAIRTNHPESPDTRPGIDISDYRCTRTLLTKLPLCPIGTAVSPKALASAELIYDELKGGRHQLSLPDHSAEGSKWFRRAEAMTWTGLGYTAVKAHLAELEGEGLLRSAIARTDRKQGREIHYRFQDSRAPPFTWRNPFDSLPTHDELTGS